MPGYCGPGVPASHLPRSPRCCPDAEPPEEWSTMLDEVRRRLHPRRLRNTGRRAKQALRKAGLAPTGPGHGRLADAGRAVPIPPKARVVLSTVLLRRPGRITVPIDRLLLGAQGGWTAREFAARTGDLRRRPDPTDEETLTGPYGRLARRGFDAGGHYFGARDDAGIIAGARSLLSGEPRERRPQQSGRIDPILVAPIRGSDHYQDLDGHHRLAHAAVRGETSVRVVTKWLPVTTPLQDLLLRMSWLDGTKELYQPIEAPELAQRWTTV